MDGFDAFGVTQPDAIPRAAATLRAFLEAGRHGDMEWMARNADRIVETGGPLGKTKKVSAVGVADISNNISGFVVVEAEDHDAAAHMFEGHPHFTIFPGDGVEVMPWLPIPTR